MSRLGRYGRFGNQIFQYAFLRLYAAQHGLQYEVPRWVGSELFGHDDPPISGTELPLLFESEDRSILSRIPNPVVNVDIFGYFQYHTSYFAVRKNQFRDLFRPLPRWRSPLDDAIARILGGGRMLVALHLRRGDFGVGKFFVAPADSYKRWIADNWKSWHRPLIYIASDQPEEVVREFAEFDPYTNKDVGVSIPAFEDYVDYYILTQADALAISNSSYSFSASMLNCMAREFVRPMYGNPALVPFDPWNSPVLLKDQVPDEDYFDIVSEAMQDALARNDAAAVERSRCQLADSWLSSHDDTLPLLFYGPLGEAHQAAIRARIFRTEPSKDDREKYLVPTLGILRAGLGTEWGIQCLLAMMLFAPPENLPIRHDLKLIPQWMLPTYVEYLRSGPGTGRTIDE